MAYTDQGPGQKALIELAREAHMLLKGRRLAALKPVKKRALRDAKAGFATKAQARMIIGILLQWRQEASNTRLRVKLKDIVTGIERALGVKEHPHNKTWGHGVPDQPRFM